MLITRRMEWDAGHRVLGHESKCAYLHGHRYAAEVTVWAPGLDGLGRVIDFGVVKQVVGAWIDENWDHNMMLHKDDPLVKTLESLVFAEEHLDLPDQLWGDRVPYIMSNGNPTAENIARELFDIATDLLRNANAALSVLSVRIYETPNCWADAVAR